MYPSGRVFLAVFGLLSAQFVAIAPIPVAPVFAQPSQSIPPLAAADQQQFERLMTDATHRQVAQKSLGEVIEHFSMELLGQPYKAGLLDQSPQEDLFLSLTQFDCVLFVESAMALAYSLRSHPTTSSQQFGETVQQLRYRGGQRDSYCSRLHYFSEWLADNQKKGYVENLTPQLQGVPLPKSLQFMSRHRSSYRQLADSKLYDCIVQMEDRLASLPMHYIPTAHIRRIESQLQPGDIIAVATSVPYLDVTHTGLIYQKGQSNQKTWQGVQQRECLPILA